MLFTIEFKIAHFKRKKTRRSIMKKALLFFALFAVVFGFNVSPVSAEAGEVSINEGDTVEFLGDNELRGIFILRGDTLLSVANPATLKAESHGLIDAHGKITADWGRVIQLNEAQANFVKRNFKIAGQAIQSIPVDIPTGSIRVCDDYNTYRDLKMDYDLDDNRRLVLRWNYGYTDIVNDFHVMVSINNGKFVYLGQTGNADEYFVFSSENQKGSELLKQGPQFGVRYTFKVVALRKWSLPDQTMSTTAFVDYKNMNPLISEPVPITPPKVSIELSGYEKQIGQVFYVLSGIPINIGIEIKSDVAVSGNIKWGDDTSVGLGGKGKDGVLSGNYSHKYYVIAGHSGNYVISYSVNGGEDVEIARVIVTIENGVPKIPTSTPTVTPIPTSTPVQEPSPTPTMTNTPKPTSTSTPYLDFTVSTGSNTISSRAVVGVTQSVIPVIEILREGNFPSEIASFNVTADSASSVISITTMTIQHEPGWKTTIQTGNQSEVTGEQRRSYTEYVVYNVVATAYFSDGTVLSVTFTVKVVDNTPPPSPPSPTPTVTPVPSEPTEPSDEFQLTWMSSSDDPSIKFVNFVNGEYVVVPTEEDGIGVQIDIPYLSLPWSFGIYRGVGLRPGEQIVQGRKYRLEVTVVARNAGKMRILLEEMSQKGMEINLTDSNSPYGIPLVDIPAGESKIIVDLTAIADSSTAPWITCWLGENMGGSFVFKDWRLSELK